MTAARVGILEMIGVVLLGAGPLGEVWQPQRIVGLDYPERALIQGLDGVVEIECYIANDGTVARAEPRSGEAALAAAAARNAMQWKFRRISSGDGTYKLIYEFRITRHSKSPRSAVFRFVMPGQIFVAAEEARSQQVLSKP